MYFLTASSWDLLTENTLYPSCHANEPRAGTVSCTHFQVPYHQKDSPAELDDIYTANVIVSGRRLATAFMLKGPGIGTKEMDIKHCGSKGTQLVRLFDAPAELFVIQFIGRIAETVVKDVEGKVTARRAQGKPAQFLIMEGQDTARVLHAYGKL